MTQAMQRRSRGDMQISGSYHNAQEINHRLTAAKNKCHLIAPVTSCGTPPEGFEVVLSVVDIDVEFYPDDHHQFWKRGKPVGDDLYHVGGAYDGAKFGLAKAVLARLEAAAGISWDSDRCRRLDNGSDAHYVHFGVTGVVKNFNNEPRIITGQKQMDLREGSPVLLAMRDRIFTKGAKKSQGDKGYKSPEQLEESYRTQLRDLRMFILEHAETKAKLRSIRQGLGVKTSYTRKELEKPFIAAKLVFTGRSDDPELKREFALMGARQALGSTNALFGAAPPVPQALPQAPMVPALAPPPVGEGGVTVDDFDEGDYSDHTEIVEEPQQAAPPARQSGGRYPLTLPGGPEKGKPLTEVSASTLEWWAANAKEDPLREACSTELWRRSPAQEPPAQAETGLPPGWEPGPDGELVPIPGYNG